jgi:hypothetical protein
MWIFTRLNELESSTCSLIRQVQILEAFLSERSERGKISFKEWIYIIKSIHYEKAVIIVLYDNAIASSVTPTAKRFLA